MALIFPDNPQINDTTVTGGRTWTWDGERWVPSGVTGFSGSLGYTGSQGYDGSQGDLGYTGSRGYDGSQGDTGFVGSKGDLGYTGSVGYDGSKGDTGYTGSVGFSGSQGNTGYTGSVGYDGSQGVAGYTGSVGSVGFVGSQGDTGFTGSQGNIGYTGSEGYVGSRGDTGFTGSQGPAGTFGGAAFEYIYSTDTSDSPNSGYVDFSNTSLNNANTLYIPFSDVLGANSYSFLQTIDDSTSAIKGHFSMADKANTLNYVLFSIIGLHTEHDTHFHVPVSYLSGTTTFTNNSNVVLTFARTGDVGDTGPIGYTGSRGNTGFVGSQGETGFTGSQGVIGYTGSQGNDGYTGSKGDTGSQGVAGYTGSLGFTGSQGNDGYTGSKGDTGAQGTTGFTGSQGNDGYTGSKGDTGAQGNTGFTGSQGNVGDTGPQGTTGFTGSVGFTGSQGNDGYTGSKGDTGAQGNVGYTGSLGYTGSEGNTGYTGSKGETGAQGTIGYTGSQGETGVQGNTGYTGSKGDTGSQGVSGYTGSQGYSGSQGNTGFTGSQGNEGQQGTTGYTGSLGYTGSQGAAGFTGSQGNVGDTGPQGTTGYTGSLGYAGSQGNTGYTGSKGDTGEQGVVGYTGSKGNDGTNGFTGSSGSTGFTGSAGTGIEAGANNQVIYKNSTGALTGSNNFTFNGTDLSVNGVIKSTYSVGDEGGEIQLATAATNSTLNGPVVIDVNANRLRIFEAGGSNRGAYIDLTAASTGVGSNLLAGGGGGGYTGSQGYTGSKGDTATANALSQHFVANGTQTTFTLGTSVSNQNNIIITINGLVQVPSIHYTISGTTLTLNTAPESNSVVEARNYEFGAGVTTIGYTGSAGFTGSIGYAGSQGSTGSQGTTGFTGSVGFTGSKGNTGEQGNTGFTGSVGYDGSQGVAGYTGSLGYTGSQGNSGYTGSVGFNGSQGSTGFTGSLGYTGSQGNTGFTGSVGYDGSQGSLGYTGSKGDTGEQGNTGYTGSIGYTGSQGSLGYTGSQGDAGSQGNVGYTGSQGDTGSQGATGYTGSKGDTGSQGNVGFTGSSGDAGFTGSAGGLGYTGSKGDTGAQGNAGFTGSSGNAGFTGSAGTGFTGSVGAGYAGSVGFTGSSGDLGYTGSVGAGYTGSKGDNGTNGYTGSKGDTATANAISQYFTANGTQTTFNLSTGVSNQNNIIVAINGLIQIPTIHYTISGSTLTLNTAPESNSLVETRNYEFGAGITTIGYTGSRGTDGIVGYNGSAGFTGSAGSLGFTGSAGAGFTGSVGFTGSSGSLGYTGSAGVGFTGSAGSVSVAGSDRQVLFNDGGYVNAVAGFTFTKSSNTLSIADGGVISVGNSTVNVFITSTTVDFSNAQHLYVPSGNTTNRPTSSNGTIRYNSFTTRLEVYANNEWQEVGSSQDAITSTSVNSGSVTTDTATILEAFVNTLEANSITIADGFSVGNSTVNTSINAIALFSGNSSTNSIFSSQRIFVGSSSANAIIKLTSEEVTVDISEVEISGSGGKILINTVQNHGLVGIRGVPYSISGSNNEFLQQFQGTQQFIPVIEDANTISLSVSPSSLRKQNAITAIYRTNGTQYYITSSEHGLKTSDSVSVTGIPDSVAKGFNLTNASITRVSDTQFSFNNSATYGNRSFAAGSTIQYAWNALAKANSGTITLTITTPSAHGFVAGEKVNIQGTFAAVTLAGSSRTIIGEWTIVTASSTSFTIAWFTKAANATAVTAKTATNITTVSVSVNRDVGSGSSPVSLSGAYVSFPINGKYSANGIIKFNTPQEISVSNATHFTKITPQSLFIGKPGTTGPNILIDPQGKIVQNVPGSSLETIIDGTGITMSSLTEFGDFVDTNTHQFFVNSSIITLGNTDSLTTITSSNVTSQQIIAASEQVGAYLTPTALNLYYYNANSDLNAANTVYGIDQAIVQGSIIARDGLVSPVVFANTFILDEETGGISANGSLGTNNQVLISNNGVAYWSSNLVITDLTVSGALYANGSSGTGGQILTSNGSSIYWATSSGGTGYAGSMGYTGSQGSQGPIGYTGSAGTGGSGSFDANVSYTWGATQTFNANVTFNSGLFGSIVPRVNSNTSASALAWTSNSFDQYQFTALAANLTIQADSGSPNNGQKMIFRIKDNGTSRTLTWTSGSSKAFRVIGTTLPTSTVVNKILYVGAIYNSTDDRWDVIATAQET